MKKIKKIETAVEHTRLLREKFLSDPYRPGYHFAVPEDIGMPKNAVLSREILEGKVKEPGDRTREELLSIEDPKPAAPQVESAAPEVETAKPLLTD